MINSPILTVKFSIFGIILLVNIKLGYLEILRPQLYQTKVSVIISAYENEGSRYSLSTDDDVARHVSKIYSYNHAIMHQGKMYYKLNVRNIIRLR